MLFVFIDVLKNAGKTAENSTNRICYLKKYLLNIFISIRYVQVLILFGLTNFINFFVF